MPHRLVVMRSSILHFGQNQCVCGGTTNGGRLGKRPVSFALVPTAATSFTAASIVIAPAAIVSGGDFLVPTARSISEAPLVIAAAVIFSGGDFLLAVPINSQYWEQCARQSLVMDPLSGSPHPLT